jgi:hypothetical protein
LLELEDVVSKVVELQGVLLKSEGSELKLDELEGLLRQWVDVLLLSEGLGTEASIQSERIQSKLDALGKPLQEWKDVLLPLEELDDFEEVDRRTDSVQLKPSELKKTLQELKDLFLLPLEQVD